MVKPLSFLSDAFRWKPFKWDIQRNDEYSGTGDGRVWQAQLAPVLWKATVEHQPLRNSIAEEMDAAIRSLRGAQEAFFLCSPLFCGPKSDPTGAVLGNAAVTISAIASTRDAVSLAGLPSGYVLSRGDKFTFSYGSDPVRYYFGEVSATAMENSAGAAASVSVFPDLPAGAAVGAAITLVKPACKVVLVPGTYKAGTSSGRFTSGGQFEVIQKK